MNTIEAQFPPLAQALGRLRQPRGWPYAPRPAATPERDTAAAPPAPRAPQHDLLRLMPEPALTGDLPEPPPRPAAVPGAEAARTYWFDL